MGRIGQSYLIGRVILLAVVVILLLLPIITSNPYYFHVLTMIALGSIFGVSMRLTWNTNILNLGHAAFAAVGAYSCVLLVMRLGLSFWVALPLGGLLAAMCAIVVGYITLRVGGVYFLVITLAFNEIVRLAAVNWTSLTGGYNGITDIPPPRIAIPGLQVFEFTSKVPYYYLILALLLGTFLVFRRIDRSRFGRVLRSIADSESMSESMGINATRCKVAAFAIGSFFAGIGGGFYAHYFAFLSPSAFTVMQSFDYFFYVFVGGAASIFGPIWGATLMTSLLEGLRGMVQFKMVCYAVILLIIVLFLPQGISSFPSIISTKIRREYKGAR